MKRSKLPTQLAKNASKLHKHIGELLTGENSLFANYELRQEYHVSKVNPDHSSNREKFDWAILGLDVVIEVHGEQHYRPVCFGGATEDEAERNFRRRLELDEEKKLAAEEACWGYVVVKYNEKDITIQELTQRILDACSNKNSGIHRPKKKKVKIPQRGNQSWPKKKLQSRGFGQKKTSHRIQPDDASQEPVE